MKMMYEVIIIMEFAEFLVEGKKSHTLKDLISIYESANKIILENDILTIMEDLTKGLEVAHALNIFHHDINDNNCFTCQG